MTKIDKVAFKRSDVADKKPTAEQLDYGEIAINYAKDSEAIFFKNSENNVVEIKTNSAVVEELNTKQDKTDNTLATTDKTVVGAINEVNTKFTNLAVGTTNLADNAVTKEKLSTDVQSSLDKADNSLQKGNVAAPTSDTDAVNKSYVDGKTENLITNDDSLNLNVPIIIYTSTDDDSIAANKANISFYLKFWEKYTLRITDTTFGDTNIRRPSNICFIPTIVAVSKSNNNALGTGIIFGYIGTPDISYYHGIFRATSSSDSTHNGSYKIVSINANTGKLESASQLISANISYSKFNTTAKDIFGAINEVNTLAKSKGNGTITEVKMNGASKGASGVVDLGTVLTAHQDISGKQDKLTSGTNIKTVNGQSLLGSGDITVGGGGVTSLGGKTGDILLGTSTEGSTHIGFEIENGPVAGGGIANTLIGRLPTMKTINNNSLLGSGNIEISAPSITVDTAMSDTSTNPVQNKVIKAYIDGLVGNVAAQLAQI